MCLLLKSGARNDDSPPPGTDSMVSSLKIAVLPFADAGGDPQQQKMMQFMPLFMLFMFYSMPSALVLYWSVSQGLSIMQMLHSRRLTDRAEAARA